MPQLTRAEMEAVIQGGGSVLHNGQTLSSIGQLPTEVDLAAGDPEAEAAAADALDAQIGQLTQQRDRLRSRGQSPIISPPSTPAPSDSSATPPPSDNPIAQQLGGQSADALAAAGYTTPESLNKATDAELLAVPGIGQATLTKIRAAFGAS